MLFRTRAKWTNEDVKALAIAKFNFKSSPAASRWFASHGANSVGAASAASSSGGVATNPATFTTSQLGLLKELTAALFQAESEVVLIALLV